MYTRIAAERLESGARPSSICFTIAAIDKLSAAAIFFNVLINSDSSEILVWCPDKDTDNLVISG
jgi:hypothetical protein